MIVRPFRQGEEPALFEVYFSAIHLAAKRDYSLEQLSAWAPRDLDPQLWAQRIRGIDPFVVELHDQIVGYADFQPNGYIDHFFVSSYHPRQGVGRFLMEEILRRAAASCVEALTSDVSRTAQPFVEHFGFKVVKYHNPVVRNVVLPNAFMRRTL